MQNVLAVRFTHAAQGAGVIRAWVRQCSLHQGARGRHCPLRELSQGREEGGEPPPARTHLRVSQAGGTPGDPRVRRAWRGPVPGGIGGTTLAAFPGIVITNVGGARARSTAHTAGKNFRGVVGRVEITRRAESSPFLTTSGPPLPAGGALPKPEESGTSITDAKGSGVDSGAVSRGGSDAGALFPGDVQAADDAVDRGGRISPHVGRARRGVTSPTSDC